MTALTAKSRAEVRLEGITALPPASVIETVREATKVVKGEATSLLTSGLQNLGAQVHVEREGAERLDLSINCGKRIVELCRAPRRDLLATMSKAARWAVARQRRTLMGPPLLICQPTATRNVGAGIASSASLRRY